MRTKLSSFRSERWQNERLTNELWAGHAEYPVLQHTERKANFPLEQKFALVEQTRYITVVLFHTVELIIFCSAIHTYSFYLPEEVLSILETLPLEEMDSFLSVAILSSGTFAMSFFLRSALSKQS